MSSLREVEDLCGEMLNRYFDTIQTDGDDGVEADSTMSESERLMFIHDWAERLRAAVLSDAHGVIRPPPLNGGGLFVRED